MKGQPQMTNTMTPSEAQDLLREWEKNEEMIDWDTCRYALQSIASMIPEHRSDIVDPFTNGGKYEVKKMTRYVTPWNEE